MSLSCFWIKSRQPVSYSRFMYPCGIKNVGSFFMSEPTVIQQSNFLRVGKNVHSIFFFFGMQTFSLFIKD